MSWSYSDASPSGACGVHKFVCHEVTCRIPFIHGCIVKWYGIEPMVFTDAEPDDPIFIFLSQLWPENQSKSII